MNNIFEIKYKVMQDKIQKFIDIINFCYIEEGEKEALLNVMQIIRTKYDKSFEKIINSKNINKSLKYKQLEEIVIQGINRIEIEIAKSINKNKDLIKETILKRYKDLKQIQDIDKRIEEIEKAKETYLYLLGYIDERFLKETYEKNKFEALLEKAKIGIIEQKEDFNVFKQIEDEKEIKVYEECLQKRIIARAEYEACLAIVKGNEEKSEEIQSLIDNIVKQEKRKFKLPSLKRKSEKKILLDDELLYQYIMLDIKQHFTENEKYIEKLPIFDIHKLQLTDSQKNSENDVKHKILYSYLTQMAKDKEYSILEIQELFKRFKIDDSLSAIKENLKLLCKYHKYDNLLKILKNGEKDFMNIYTSFFARSNTIFKIKVNLPRKITQRLVKIEITPNKYQDTPVFHPFILGKENKKREVKHTFEKGMEVENMYKALSGEVGEDTTKFDGKKSEYEENISPELNKLRIWNKFIEIDSKGRYVITVSLDDFEELPIDENKLKVTYDKDLQKEYIEKRIKDLKNLVNYCIPEIEIHKEQKNIFKTELNHIIWSLSETFYDTYYLSDSELLILSQERLNDINKLNQNVIDYIEKSISVKSISEYVQEKLQEIDGKMSFFDSISELQKMNIINEVDISNQPAFIDDYRNKKFEVLCRRILQEDIRNLENPNEEEILEKIIFPHCSKIEREKFEKEFRKIIKYIIIEKKTSIPIESEIGDITLFRSFGDDLRQIKDKVLKEMIENNNSVEKIEEQER